MKRLLLRVPVLCALLVGPAPRTSAQIVSRSPGPPPGPLVLYDDFSGPGIAPDRVDRDLGRLLRPA